VGVQDTRSGLLPGDGPVGDSAECRAVEARIAAELARFTRPAGPPGMGAAPPAYVRRHAVEHHVGRELLGDVAGNAAKALAAAEIISLAFSPPLLMASRAVRTAVRENRAFLGRAVRYLAGEAGPPTVLVHKTCGQELRQGFYCASCRQTFSPADISSRPGPAASGAPVDCITVVRSQTSCIASVAPIRIGSLGRGTERVSGGRPDDIRLSFNEAPEI